MKVILSGLGLLLVVGLLASLAIFHYQECRMVGHSVLYCILFHQ